MAETPRIRLSESLEISRLAFGFWRLAEWKKSKQEILQLVEQLMEWGITTFDHADIYGDYTCEKLFGDAIAGNCSLRDRMQIVTKCGIKLMSGHYPDRRIKSYDYSYGHIVSSVERSLTELGTDHIELLLFHRPAPFFDPEEASRAMEDLHNSGKVLHFGLSNFLPLQYDMMQRNTNLKLVTNQVELSAYCLEHFENGNMDHFLREHIHPMAWSPLAGGRIFKPRDEKGARLLAELNNVGRELNSESVDAVAYAWLMKHPVKVIPVIGSGKIGRIRRAVDSLKLEMTQEQWYRIYNASTGRELA